MNNSGKKKKEKYNKMEFSDNQIEQQMEQDVKKIRQKNINEVSKQQEIFNLYNKYKDQKKKRQILFNDQPNPLYKNQNKHYHLQQDDQQQGQVHQPENQINKPTSTNEPPLQDIFKTLTDKIISLTVTRSRILDFLNSPRFQQLVKGCFVRYLSDKSSNSGSAYMIAHVVGVVQGTKQYNLETIRTKFLLKLQQTSQVIVTLSVQLISNKHPPGSLQIDKWLRANRNNIPKQADLIKKLEEFNKLLNQNLSSQQIDNNIFKKAKRIAEKTEEPKQDIRYLIDFIDGKIHNMEMQYQQILDEKGVQKGKQEINEVQKNKQESKKISSKLKQLLAQIKNKKTQNNQLRQLADNQTQQSSKSKGNITKKLLQKYSTKKEDQINQKVKEKHAMLSTYQGYVNVKKKIIEAHENFQFPFDV